MCRPRTQAGRPRSTTSAPAATCRTSKQVDRHHADTDHAVAAAAARDDRHEAAEDQHDDERDEAMGDVDGRRLAAGSENPLPQSGQLVQPAPEPVSTTNAPLMATR